MDFSSFLFAMSSSFSISIVPASLTQPAFDCHPFSSDGKEEWVFALVGRGGGAGRLSSLAVVSVRIDRRFSSRILERAGSVSCPDSSLLRRFERDLNSATNFFIFAIRPSSFPRTPSRFHCIPAQSLAEIPRNEHCPPPKIDFHASPPPSSFVRFSDRGTIRCTGNYLRPAARSVQDGVRPEIVETSYRAFFSCSVARSTASSWDCSRGVRMTWRGGIKRNSALMKLPLFKLECTPLSRQNEQKEILTTAEVSDISTRTVRDALAVRPSLAVVGNR